jgi:transcriptional regulator with XRE-family HTH domain
LAGMHLKTFMELNGITEAQMAKLIGRSQPVVNRLRNGVAKPSFAVMIALEKVTNGQVKPSDFIEAA